MNVVCRGAIAPDNLTAPPCDSIGLPPCTFRQYYNELSAIRKVTVDYQGGPVGMEEHLAADQNCALAVSTMRRPGANPTADLLSGVLFFNALIFMGIVLALVLDQISLKDEPNPADRKA